VSRLIARPNIAAPVSWRGRVLQPGTAFKDVACRTTTFRVDGTLIEGVGQHEEELSPKGTAAASPRRPGRNGRARGPFMVEEAPGKRDPPHPRPPIPDCPGLYRKGVGASRPRPCLSRARSDGRTGTPLVVDTRLTLATGTAERRRAGLGDDGRPVPAITRITLGADKAYDVAGFGRRSARAQT